MNNLIKITGLAGLAALCCVGCQKTEDTTTDDAMDAVQGSEPAVAVEEVSIEETVTETAENAKQVLADANAKAQELLTQAQNLVGEKKYEEAAGLLQKLGDFELTPDQQKLLDNLKATIKKAMESDAVKEGTKALGNMLDGQN